MLIRLVIHHRIRANITVDVLESSCVIDIVERVTYGGLVGEVFLEKALHFRAMKNLCLRVAYL